MELTNCQEVLKLWGEKVRKELSFNMSGIFRSDFYGALKPSSEVWKPTVSLKPTAKLFSDAGVL